MCPRFFPRRESRPSFFEGCFFARLLTGATDARAQSALPEGGGVASCSLFLHVGESQAELEPAVAFQCPGKIADSKREGFLKHVTPSIVKKVVMNVALLQQRNPEAMGVGGRMRRQ